MFVASLSAENFRSFTTLEVKFERPGNKNRSDDGFLNNVNLLLGNNGAGKTTVLKALSLSVLSPVIQESGYRPYYLLRRTAGNRIERAIVRCELELHGQDIGAGFNDLLATSKAAATIYGRGNYERIESDRTLPHIDLIFNDDSPAYFLLGYGATRRVESVERLDFHGRSRSVRYQRVAGLFEDYVTLFPMGAWMPKLKESSSSRFDEVMSLLNSVLPNDTEFLGAFEDFEPLFMHRGLQLPFGCLSDGYRSFIGLIADMLYHLHTACPKSHRIADLAGCVLVDDIDLNLHPTWQQVVVTSLAKAFPNLQFVLTTHSPIVTGTLHAQNVRLVEEKSVTELSESIHGLSADQILLSPYFNLSSTRSSAAQERLAKLTEEVAQYGDPKGAIAFLKQLSNGTE